MERLMEVGDRHSEHLGHHLGQLWWRGVLEAVALVGSAVLSFWMLRLQIYRGYQQLV